MNREILTARMPVRDTDAVITVLYEAGKAAEIYVEPFGRVSDLGCIRNGIVETVEKGISAAFVRIAPDRRVYLPLSAGDIGRLKGGDVVTVQIEQEAQKSKLPRVKRDWDIAGRYLVLTEGRNGLAFSRKLSSEDRERLRMIGRHWDTSGWKLLFRTNAAGCEAAELQREFAELTEQAEEIRRKSATRSAGSVLYRAPGLQERLIKQCAAGGLGRFVTDIPDIRDRVEEECRKTGIGPELYDDPALALYRLWNLTTLLERALAREVHLPSGGQLVIEQTEAFTAVDVNTARAGMKRAKDELIRRINREAADEAARQIRLRQLSGTILIDFINSRDPNDDAELTLRLTQAFRADPVHTKFVDITALHICEITRRKQNRSLQEQVRRLGDEHGKNCQL